MAVAGSRLGSHLSRAARDVGRCLSSLPFDRLPRAITPAVCAELRSQGYAVVDGVFGAAATSALRDEVAALRDHMHTNCTHLVRGRGGAAELLPKRDIFEAELLLEATAARAPLCAALQRDAALRTMLSLLLPELRLGRQAVKAQRNAGGGACFPLHWDTDAAVDGRRVTAIWYLNPGWAPEHGGQLRLLPFPSAAVDIEPRDDRLVLFSSQRMLHRVLPSLAERFCVTMWLSEGPRRGGGSGAGGAAAQREAVTRALSSGRELGDDEAWRLLLSDELRAHAAKWLYREEWARSLEESHPLGAGRNALLEGFARECGVIERALRPLLPALQRGAPPAPELQRRWF